jgi:hypothetical protein
MKPATKEMLKWLGKRVGGWILFMAVTLTVMSNLRGSSPSTLETVLFWVFTSGRGAWARRPHRALPPVGRLLGMASETGADDAKAF